MRFSAHPHTAADAIAGRTEFTYSGEVSGLQTAAPPACLPNPSPSPPRWKFPRAAARECCVTDGGRFGGYGLYVLKGKPVFTYNLLALERFRWEGAQSARRRANTPSCLISNTTGPAWPRPARAFSPWTARKSPKDDPAHHPGAFDH